MTYTAPDSPKSSDLGRQLCQHVIGMSPRSVGELGVDEPNACKEDETCMVHQEYLLDPEVTVGQLLTDAGASVVTFKRFECGEPDELPESEEEKRTVRAEG